MTDIADLVAKLDADIAWIDARRESGQGMWPTDIKFGYDDAVELRRIVVAAKEYVKASHALFVASCVDDGASTNLREAMRVYAETKAALVAAVGGGQG